MRNTFETLHNHFGFSREAKLAVKAIGAEVVTVKDRATRIATHWVACPQQGSVDKNSAWVANVLRPALRQAGMGV